MVKLDIITGFLGSGKTTLIKKLLNSLDSDEKIVLIENEFGDVSVDREVLEIEGFEIYELSNGCVCCKLKGDFIAKLQSDPVQHWPAISAPETQAAAKGHRNAPNLSAEFPERTA